MRFTFYRDQYDVSTANQRDMSIEDVKRYLTTHVEQAGKERAGFSPTSFAPGPCRCSKPTCPGMQGHRIVANVREVYMMPIDLDRSALGGDLGSPEDMQHLETIKVKGLAYIAHTSHSYAPPVMAKWHVFIPFSRPVPGPDYQRIWRAAIKWLGVPTGVVTDNAARFWNQPSCPPGARRHAIVQPGAPLDVDWLYSIAEPPRDVVGELQPATDPASDAVLRSAQAELSSMGPAIEGQDGSGKCFRAARILVDEYALADHEALALLREWSLTCRPPWTDDELIHKINSARSHGESPEYGKHRMLAEDMAFLTELTRPPPGSFAELMTDAKHRWDAEMVAENSPTAVEPMFMSGRELASRSFPKTHWLVRGVAPQEGIMVIACEPKAGKTWAATEIALSIASGSPAFGEFEVVRGNVAYFYAEDPGASVQSRIRALCRGKGMQDIPEGLYTQPQGRALDLLDDFEVVTLLASAMRIPDLKMLVLDPLRDIHSGVEDSSDEMAKVMRRLRALAKLLDCLVVFVHHNNKGGGDGTKRFGQRMRGSSAVHGAINAGMYLVGTQNDGATVINQCYVELKAGRAVTPFSLQLDIEDDTQGVAHKATWEIGELEAAQYDDELISEIVDVIGSCAMRCDPPPTLREIHAVLKGPRMAVASALKRAEEMHYVQQHIVGNIARGWALTQQGESLFASVSAAKQIGGNL